jgi:hypothetical protein
MTLWSVVHGFRTRLGAELSALPHGRQLGPGLGAHLGAQRRVGQAVTIESEGSVEWTNAIEPSLLGVDQNIRIGKDLQDLEDELVATMLIPGSLKVATVMSSPRKVLPVSTPPVRNVDRRADVDLAVEQAANLIDAALRITIFRGHDLAPRKRVVFGAPSDTSRRRPMILSESDASIYLRASRSHGMPPAAG